MLSVRMRTTLRTVERYVRPNTRSLTNTSSSSSPSNLPILDPETERAYASTIIHGRSRLPAYFHPKTHGIPVAVLHVRSHFKELADMYMHFASHAAAALGMPASQPAHLPTQRSLWTVLKSPFVHKKSQENFERKVHKRAMKIWDSDERVVTRWLQYLQMYPLPGVGMRVVRWHRAPLGVGKTHDEGKSKVQLETRRLENVTDRQRIEEVAARIIKQEMESANVTDVPTTSEPRKKFQ